MTAVSNLADFQALDPFFRIIEQGVAVLVGRLASPDRRSFLRSPVRNSCQANF
jgi:hypothetical protein